MGYATSKVAGAIKDGGWYTAQEIATKLDLTIGHVRETLKTMRRRNTVRVQREPRGRRYFYSLSRGQSWESWVAANLWTHT